MEYLFPEYIFISRLVNPELIRYVTKISYKSNLEIIFKRGKIVFFENDGVQEDIC